MTTTDEVAAIKALAIASLNDAQDNWNEIYQHGFKAGYVQGIRDERARHPRVVQPRIRWVTTQQLVTDTLALAAKLPPDIRGIVGIPRSGMIVASIIATHLNLPLFCATSCSRSSDGEVIFVCSGGRRTEWNDETAVATHQCVLVDDSVNTGQSFTQSLRSRVACTAAVYVNPLNRNVVDFVGRDWELPHVFSWHLWGSDLVETVMTDLDGVLCDDCPPEYDDDGDKYIAWMKSVRPKWLPRPHTVDTIVTARLDKYHDVTCEWLQRHGVSFRRLLMGPWASKADRDANYNAAEFKGEAYMRSGMRYFFESDDAQAKAIFQHTRMPVICPNSNSVYQEELE